MVAIIGQRIPIRATGVPVQKDNIGGIFSSFAKPFLDGVGTDIKREQFARLRDTNLGIEEMRQAVNAARESGSVSPADLYMGALSAGRKADDASGFGTGMSSVIQGVDSPLTQRWLTAEGRYPQSPLHQQRANENAMDMQEAQERTKLAIQQRANENAMGMQEAQERTKLAIAAQTPRTVIVDGVPMNVRQDASYNMPASVPLSEQQGAEARRRLDQPGGLASLDRPTQKFVGAQPAEQSIVNAEVPGVGVVPAVQGQDGRLQHVQTQQTLPNDIGVVGRLQATKAEDLGGTNPVVKQLYETRVATDQAKGAISRLSDHLSRPNSDQASGYVGQAASLFNDMRSQYEAVARLVNPNDRGLQGELEATGVAASIDAVMRDQNLAATAQRLGIDHALLRSQITNLAYAIAKANDPGGRMSDQDIQNAGRIIGTSLMDPVSARTILQDLAVRLDQQQEIRERALRETYGDRVKTPLRTGSGAAPASGAPREGATATGPNGERLIVRDGKLVPLQ